MPKLLIPAVEEPIAVFVSFALSISTLMWLRWLGDKRAIRNCRCSPERVIRWRRAMQLPFWILAFEAFVVTLFSWSYF